MKKEEPSPPLPISTSQIFDNILELDHRAIKRRVKAKQSFRELRGAQRMIAGYEAMHMNRKGQECGQRR
jgi:putative transposase